MSSARVRSSRRQPPFELEGLNWKEYTRGYKHTIHLIMDQNERRRWIGNRNLNDFRVFSCGHYVEARGLTWERKGLDEGILIYCVAGKGHFRQGRKEWTVNPGDLLYCFPRTHHSYRADEREPWTIHWMHVSGPRLGHYERMLRLTPAQPVLHLGLQPEIIFLFNMLYGLFHPAHDDQRLQAIWACAHLIFSKIAILPSSALLSPRQLRKIQDILEIMDQDVEAGHDLARFAELAGVTPEHFSRLFRKVTGFSPIDYFLHLKIRKACALLATTDLLVKQIAFQLSFRNHTHFTRLFKRVIGLSPNQYRRSLID